MTVEMKENNANAPYNFREVNFVLEETEIDLQLRNEEITDSLSITFHWTRFFQSWINCLYFQKEILK